MFDGWNATDTVAPTMAGLVGPSALLNSNGFILQTLSSVLFGPEALAAIQGAAGDGGD